MAFRSGGSPRPSAASRAFGPRASRPRRRRLTSAGSLHSSRSTTRRPAHALSSCWAGSQRTLVLSLTLTRVTTSQPSDACTRVVPHSSDLRGSGLRYAHIASLAGGGRPGSARPCAVGGELPWVHSGVGCQAPKRPSLNTKWSGEGTLFEPSPRIRDDGSWACPRPRCSCFVRGQTLTSGDRSPGGRPVVGVQVQLQEIHVGFEDPADAALYVPFDQGAPGRIEAPCLGGTVDLV